MSQPTSWIAAIVVAAAVLPPQAHADGKNEIRAVTFDDADGTTRVHVRGAQTPTFTVYKLERPTRVVIDVPQARLAEALRGHEGASVQTPSTWAVSTIAAQQLDDGGQVVRVIVTLARPGRYDVKTEGNELIVMVSARDPAPKTASPEALAAAEQARAAAVASATAAQAEADRLRKAAADQAARADAAQKAVDAARRTGATNAAEVDRAKAAAVQAQDEAAKAKANADRARVVAEQAQRDAAAETGRAKVDAERARAQAAAAQAEASKTKQDAARELDAAAKAKAAAEAAMQQANRDAAATKKDADAAIHAAEAQKVAAQQAAEAVKQQAQAAKQDVARSREDIARTRAEAETAKADAAKAQADAKRELDAATRARTEAEAARREAEAAKQDALKTRAQATAAKDDIARTRAEAEAARSDADKASALAKASRAEAEAAKAEAAQKQAEAIAAKAQTAAAQREALAAKDDSAAAKADSARSHADITRLKAEAEAARTDAAKARADADTVKAQAAVDKKKAETARGDAEKLLRDAQARMTELDQRTAAAQTAEDKARAANAAAQAREEAARTAVAKAADERAAAEQAAKRAADARDRSTTQAASDRQKLVGEAQAAEARLAAARKATEAAEQQRAAAEGAASVAKHDLDQSRTALATVEHQRTAAETAASDAAHKRSEAESAATDAVRRRSEAETAVGIAAKQRADAEQAATFAAKQRTDAERERDAARQQKQAAEEAAKVAKAAAEAADKQRAVAEQAAGKAETAKHDAEVGLAELSTRRQDAEKAAAALEVRSKAEAKAQAELVAAQVRKASEAEQTKIRGDLAKLSDERKHAETELGDRRKAVAAQQAEADRLRLAATSAHDAADREETRRTELAAARVAEETELARIKAAKTAVAAAPPPPAPAKPKTPIAKVSNITFAGDDAGGQVTIALAGDAKVTTGEVSATAAELIIDHAELGAKLERKLDVSRFGSPIRAVSSFRDRRTPERVRLIVELATPATPVVDRDTGGLRWKFTTTAKHQVARTQNVPSPVVGGFGAASTPIAQQSVSQLPAQGRRQRVYHGAPVELHYKDAPIHDLLRSLADVGKVNIVVPDTIDFKVTVDMKRVPWDEALEVILSSHDLWYRKQGNLYRIAPRKELDAEDEAEAKRREASVAAESPRTDIVPLNYASAIDLQKKLDNLKSPKGHIEVDERGNKLIITDVAGNREQIKQLALQLDTQTPQISIEARVVEARSTFLRQIGIQWGGNANASAAGGNATGLVWPSSVGIVGGNEDQNTNRGGVALPSDFAVNMPASTGTGEGGAVGISLGSVAGNFNINLRLSALEDSGTVRIISAPKITVLNGKEAKIAQGVSIPISVVSAAGTSTQFVQADLALTVRPTVSQRDCAISMELVVTKNEPDFVNVGARGDPTILRKEARTSMLINDGQTSVLGGIYTRNSGLAYKKVPFFGDLPVLGWLFKNRRENDDRTEILVFVTPKITNRELLTCTP